MDIQLLVVYILSFAICARFGEEFRPVKLVTKVYGNILLINERTIGTFLVNISTKPEAHFINIYSTACNCILDVAQDTGTVFVSLPLQDSQILPSSHWLSCESGSRIQRRHFD